MLSFWIARTSKEGRVGQRGLRDWWRKDRVVSMLTISRRSEDDGPRLFGRKVLTGLRTKSGIVILIRCDVM